MTEAQAILNASILVVDDVQDNVDLLTDLLGFAGFTNVRGTVDPFDVTDLHQQHDFDLILLDIQMPGIDGFEVMRRLKAIKPETDLPVIAITAHHDYKQRVLQSGARDFIGKPFEFADLVRRISAAIEARLRHKQIASMAAQPEDLPGATPAP